MFDIGIYRENEMEPKVDPVVAGVIARLTPTARKRLDALIDQKRSNPSATGLHFVATASEMPGVVGVKCLEGEFKNGNFVTKIITPNKGTWTREALTVKTHLPATVIAGMRGKRFDQVIDSPLFSDLVISTARENEGSIIIEAKRRPWVDISTIPAIGTPVHVDLLTELRAKNVERVCFVAVELLQWMNADKRSIIAGRLSDQDAIRITDLHQWLPQSVTWLSLSIHEGTLWAGAGLTVGHLSRGSLYLGGADRKNAQILSGSLFWRFRGSKGGSSMRQPKTKSITLDEFAAIIQKRDGTQTAMAA